MTGTRFRRFAALGDTFSAGVEGDLSMPWPDHAARALAGDRGELAYRNFATAGATSIDVAILQLPPTAEFGPDLISVICGANDLLAARLDPEVFAAVFDGIVDSLRRRLPGALIVTATYPGIASLLGPLREPTGVPIERAVETVNVAIRRIASHRGLVCLDLAGDPHVRTPPGVARQQFHSSAEAHRHVGAAFAAGAAPPTASAATSRSPPSARWTAKPSDRSAWR
jgi:hypothetical protein